MAVSKLESSSADTPTSPAESPAPGPAQEVPHVAVGAFAPAPVPVSGSAHSAEIGLLMEHLAYAQEKLRGALKDSQNPHLRNKYADLSSVWAAWQEVGPGAGLALVQLTEAGPATVTVHTQLGHESGQWIRSSLTLPWEQGKGITPAQAIGSALTYARRYALAALVGVCPEDDDGASSGRPREEVRTAPQAAARNGNGVAKHPAAERAAQQAAIMPEIMGLLCEVCGIRNEDGTWDMPMTVAQAGEFLPSANREQPGLVPVLPDGRATLQGATPAQLIGIRDWLKEQVEALGVAAF